MVALQQGLYFWEIGREQPDGAIVGTVEKMVGENLARRVGGFKIAANGELLWFVGMKAAEIARVNDEKLRRRG